MNMTSIDRSAVNHALSKAIAYKQCGKDMTAADWACELITLLGLAGILNDKAKAQAESYIGLTR